MTRLQLAKIVQWAGTLNARKRLQKVIYLLQANGCPIEAEYTLHHYGPYSVDVARLADELVAEGALKEKSVTNMVGNQFCYTLSPEAELQLAEVEQREPNAAGPILKYEKIAKRLCEADLKILEFASTIAYFRKQGESWPQAAKSAAQFKSVGQEILHMKTALNLAKELVA